jgi:hypothetical protein
VVFDGEHRPLVSAYAFFVHVRHPAFRLIVKADALFPTETNRAEWRRTRVREAADVNAEVREAVDRDGYSLFKIGLKLSEMPKDWRNKAPSLALPLQTHTRRRRWDAEFCCGFWVCQSR